MTRWSLGIDVGGTFVDLSAVSSAGERREFRSRGIQAPADAMPQVRRKQRLPRLRRHRACVQVCPVLPGQRENVGETLGEQDTDGRRLALEQRVRGHGGPVQETVDRGRGDGLRGQEVLQHGQHGAPGSVRAQRPLAHPALA